MEYPPLALVQQHFTAEALADVDTTLKEKLAALHPDKRIHPGQSVAITAGSRGITDMAAVLKTIAGEMKRLGAHPFIVPAMGSHGGATASGQERLLAGYSITEETIGAPIRSSMEVVELGTSSLGLPVYFDRTAAAADHIVVVNRVKPHTDFEAPVESGLVKMMTIGLGKEKGATQYHNAVLHHGYYDTLMAHGAMILDKAPITLAVGLVENQLEHTAVIAAAWKEDMVELDMNLLETARTLLPKIPVAEIDLLIVDEMGKNISGTGMDQNVIARTVIRVGTAPDTPKIRRIFVRDLTDKSQGMATCIGNADFTTSRLVAKIDREATYVNCLAACEPEMAAIPPYYDSDREVLDRALATIGLVNPAEAKIVRIRNTLDLQYLLVSPALLAELQEVQGVEILSEPKPISFSAGGDLHPPWPQHP